MPVADLGFDTFGETTPGSGPINNTASGAREPQVGMVQKAWDSWRRKRPQDRGRYGKQGAKKRKQDAAAQDEEDEDDDINDEDDDDVATGQEDEEVKEENSEMTEIQNKNGNDKDNESAKGGDASKDNGNFQKSVYTCKSAAPKLVIPGHTGYLTFATLFPEFA